MIEVKQLKSVDYLSVLNKLKVDNPQLPNLYSELEINVMVIKNGVMILFINFVGRKKIGILIP